MLHVIPYNVKKNKKVKAVTPIYTLINYVEWDVTGSSKSSSFHRDTPSCHLFAYQDMTLYITKKSFYSLYQSFYYQHDQSGIFITNINQQYHPSSSSIMLSKSATRVLKTPNAGGNSIWSETLSAEFLYRFLGLKVIYTEMELNYNSRNTPITDFACLSSYPENNIIGVSVTRAMAYRSFLTKKEATRLLTKKLKGVQLSTKNVLNCQFQRQILHIWVQTGRDASIVKQAYLKLSSSFYSNTILYL
ncbi:unnamed protein product [Cunninghamella blakesleeana]